MTEEQVRLIQESWARASASAERTAGLFYGRLLGTDPGIARMFASSDLDAQGLRFMRMMDTAVSHVRAAGPVGTAMQPRDTFTTLGRRHAGIGVRAEHYHALGDALVWALKRVLGPAFTPAHEDAWWEMMTLISGVMQEGGGPPPGHPG
jgi:hemoglobin-like flavoprotein